MERQTLKEFLERSWAALSTEERPLLARLQEIRLEKESLRKAASASGIELPGMNTGGRKQERSLPLRLPNKTMKQAIVELLKSTKNGMSALEILSSLNEKHGTVFSRASLSPQLSRLKQDGVISAKDGAWYLTKPNEHGNGDLLDIV